MVTITAVVLAHTYNEKLKLALQSVLFCDEILVLTDTKDLTKNLFDTKTQHKITILYEPIKNDFSQKRNIGLLKATSDWVLFLDSDEIIPHTLKNEILDAIEHKQIYGYFIKREDMFMGKILKHGDPSSVMLLRLARKDAGVWKRPVHEYWDVTKKTDILSHAISHIPHDSIESFLQKINRYTTIEALYRKQQGKKFSLFETLLFPPIKFLYSYIIQLGILDGFPGLCMSYMMSVHSLCVRIKMYEK